MDLPKRKTTRLKGYDYSLCGAYFVTLCTHNRAMLFGDTGEDSTSAHATGSPPTQAVGADSISARIMGSVAARMIHASFLATMEQYPHAHCSIYVIMPNHMHAIIILDHEEADRRRRDMGRADMESAPTTLSAIIQAFKRYSTIEYIKLVKRGIVPPFEKQIWQRSYHDHIIRDEREYQQIWEYIDSNPLNWEEDCYR